MKFFAYLVCYLIYPFSFLFPRNKRKCAFGSFRGAFNDNAKYLFIHVSEQRPEINSVWLSISKSTVKEMRGKGLNARYVLSPKGIWAALTSGFWIFNAYSSDIMFCLSGGATLVNLWHGLPMKRIEFDITSGPLAERYAKCTMKERYYHPETFRRPDYLLSASPLFTEIFARSFRITSDRCLELGYPRNEILTCPECERMKFVEKYEPQQTKDLIETLTGKHFQRVFVYLPTWRDSQRDFFARDFDLKRMDATMKQVGSILLLKPHPNLVVDDEAVKGLDNVVLLPSRMDVYPILPYTDVLITDYSSVLFDYVLMENKGVVLYLYDFQEYKDERNFTAPFDDLSIGKRAYDFESLLMSIQNADYHLDDEGRKAFVRKCWGNNPTPSCAEIVKSLHFS